MPCFSISAHSQNTESSLKDALGSDKEANVERESSPLGHTLLHIDQQTVLLHFDILLQLLFALLHHLIGLTRLLVLCLQQLDVLLHLTDHLDEPAVSLVVAVLHLRSSDPFLETSLRNFQRRVLCQDRPFDFVHAPFHVGQFLKRELRKKGKGSCFTLKTCGCCVFTFKWRNFMPPQKSFHAKKRPRQSQTEHEIQNTGKTLKLTRVTTQYCTWHKGIESLSLALIS